MADSQPLLTNPHPIQRWSTADVPQAKRLDYFAAALSEAVLPIGINSGDPRTFRVEMSFVCFAGIALCKTLGSAHSSFRGRNEIARSSDHSFNLVTIVDAPWVAHHRGAWHLSPRDVLILDSDYPLTVDQGAPTHVAINVGVSEAWLRQWLPDPHVLAMRRIPGGSLWSQALSSYLCELTPEFASAPPLPLSLIADQVGSLLALTASGMHGATVANAAALRSLFEQILDCLAQRCAEPQLTAAEVAASLNISVRTLHRTFAAAHETFGEKLIEARARVALRMLMSPLFNRVTTGEIGKRAGFLNPSHFAKVMRVRTGRTPLQLRNAAHTDAVERDVSSERA